MAKKYIILWAMFVYSSIAFAAQVPTNTNDDRLLTTHERGAFLAHQVFLGSQQYQAKLVEISMCQDSQAKLKLAQEAQESLVHSYKAAQMYTAHCSSNNCSESQLVLSETQDGKVVYNQLELLDVVIQHNNSLFLENKFLRERIKRYEESSTTDQ